MENSSVRMRAQHNQTQPTRRDVLTIAAGVPLVAVSVPAVVLDIAPPRITALPDEIAGYYTFMALEAAAIEARYGLTRADRMTLAAGERRAVEMQKGSTIDQRCAWLCAFTDSRALFSVKEV